MACRSIPSARTAGFPLNLKSSFAHVVVVVVFVAAAVAVAIVLSDIVSSHCSLTSTSLERALPCLSAPATILPTKRLKGHILFACDVFTNPTIQQHWIPLKSYSEQVKSRYSRKRLATYRAPLDFKPVKNFIYEKKFFFVSSKSRKGGPSFLIDNEC